MVDRIKEVGAKRIFLTSDDRAHFLAGFLAALYAGVPVVLPQSDTPEFLTDLMQPGDVLLTNQHHLGQIISTFIPMYCDYDVRSAREFTPLNPQQAVVIFFTSGSTGKPKAVIKKLQQLETEVETLHQLYGQGNQGRFLSTVSHHHLYALLVFFVMASVWGFQVGTWHIYLLG